MYGFRAIAVSRNATVDAVMYINCRQCEEMYLNSRIDSRSAKWSTDCLIRQSGTLRYNAVTAIELIAFLSTLWTLSTAIIVQ